MLCLSRAPRAKAMDEDNKLNSEEAVGNLDNFFGHVNLNKDGFTDVDEAETVQKLLAQRQDN